MLGSLETTLHLRLQFLRHLGVFTTSTASSYCPDSNRFRSSHSACQYRISISLCYKGELDRSGILDRLLLTYEARTSGGGRSSPTRWLEPALPLANSCSAVVSLSAHNDKGRSLHLRDNSTYHIAISQLARWSSHSYRRIMTGCRKIMMTIDLWTIRQS